MEKRIFDIVVAGAALLLTLPITAAIGVTIHLSSPGPVFFRQERVGLHGKRFMLAKFRSMVTSSASAGRRLTVLGDPRVTPVGRFLRKYKLDELPQLINVLKGDMSIVGPRPELPEYVEIYADAYQRILQVRPGLTDYAAIRFRNEEGLLSQSGDPERDYVENVLPAKIALYHEYVEKRSFWIDLILIAKTAWILVR